MNRSYIQVFLLTLCTLLIAACQNAQHVVDGLRIKQLNQAPHEQNVMIYCAGVEHCDFERLNDIAVIDPVTHRINPQAISKGIVRLHGSVFNPQSVYLSVPAKEYELVIRYYPISRDRAEVFHVIHDFKPHHRYTLRMYRQRSQQSNSLLNASMPDPLCVVLEQDEKAIRRFCRPYNAVTGLGEFVEKKL